MGDDAGETRGADQEGICVLRSSCVISASVGEPLKGKTFFRFSHHVKSGKEKTS